MGLSKILGTAALALGVGVFGGCGSSRDVQIYSLDYECATTSNRKTEDKQEYVKTFYVKSNKPIPTYGDGTLLVEANFYKEGERVDIEGLDTLDLSQVVIGVQGNRFNDSCVEFPTYRAVGFALTHAEVPSKSVDEVRFRFKKYPQRVLKNGEWINDPNPQYIVQEFGMALTPQIIANLYGDHMDWERDYYRRNGELGFRGAGVGNSKITESILAGEVYDQ